MRLVKFRCVSITPFGFPVVPDVKMMEAVALALTDLGSPATRFCSVASGVSA